MALLAFFISWLVKKDPSNKELAEQDPKPFKTFMSKGKGVRKRKLSSVERDEEEDLQRQTMIRKSLASRTSTHRASTLYTEDEFQMHDNDDDDDEDEDELDNQPNSPTLKSDWKAYEADLQRNRSVLIRRHPGIDRSGGSSSDAPLSPLSPTPSMVSPITPATSPQASPATRHHTFHTIPRKPVASSPESTDGQSRPGVGRATTLA